MAPVGDALRAARESRGLTLEQAERATRIRRVFLEAIEEDRFDVLPAPVYARGLIRNYAQLLELDPGDIVGAYSAATGTAPPIHTPQVLDEPLVQRSGHSPLVGVLWGIIIVLAIAAAGWYAYMRFYLGETPRLPSLPISVPRSPAELETPVFATPTSQTGLVVPAPAEVNEPTGLPPPTLSPGATPTATPSPQEEMAEATSVPSVTPVALLPTPTATPTAAVTVEATITAATYVEVTADGERLLTATLQAGDERTWTGEESVALRIGNAGGIELKVNGVKVPPLGEAGQVVNIEYTPDNLPQG